MAVASIAPRKLGALAGSIAVLMAGCVLNNLGLEYIVSGKVEWSDARAGSLLTFLQFAFISLVSSPYAIGWAPAPAPGSPLPWSLSLLPSRVPLAEYALMTALFALMSWLNNLAFAFHISQPMHMVFRSSNLMISFIFGWAVKGKRYTSGQLVAVTLLTLGAGLATMAEARVGDTAAAAANLGGGCGGCGSDPLPSLEMNAAGAAYMWTWGTGVAILTAVLLLQTLLGSRQDDSSKLYGHAPFEAMFYMHTLSLPVLLLLGGRDFSGSIAKWSASPRADTVVASLVADAGTGSAARAAGAAFLWLSGALSPLRLDFASLPVLWLQVAANVATQWVCLMGVYSLIAAADQLTVNVILTLRKFVSLMLSIALFGNTFTTYHWVGSVAVFGGAALFSASGSGSTPAKAGEAVNRVKGARKGSQGSAKRDRSPARLARKKAS